MLIKSLKLTSIYIPTPILNNTKTLEDVNFHQPLAFYKISSRDIYNSNFLKSETSEVQNVVNQEIKFAHNAKKEGTYIVKEITLEIEF